MNVYLLSLILHIFVNVDLITSDFTVDNTVICDSEGIISLESTSLVDTDFTFTYSWMLVKVHLAQDGDLSSSTTHYYLHQGTYGCRI